MFFERQNTFHKNNRCRAAVEAAFSIQSCCSVHTHTHTHRQKDKYRRIQRQVEDDRAQNQL